MMFDWKGIATPAKRVALWFGIIVATPALAINWWEWQRALGWLTSLSWDMRAGLGFCFAFANVLGITVLAIDRGWFKKDPK